MSSWIVVATEFALSGPVWRCDQECRLTVDSYHSADLLNAYLSQLIHLAYWLIRVHSNEMMRTAEAIDAA